MTRKTLLMMASCIALGALSACQTTPPMDQPVDLTFAQMAPMQLNVGSVQVVNNTQPTPAANPRVIPAVALQNYARQRLQAVGGEGTLNFVIQQATLLTRQAQSTGNWTENFQLGVPMEYTVTMRVGLDLVDRVTQPNVKSAFTLERKTTLPAGVSLAQRDRELGELVANMIKDVDKAVERGLSDNMHIVVQPGMMPVQPSSSVTTYPVQPAPATNRPVTYTGTMN